MLVRADVALIVVTVVLMVDVAVVSVVHVVSVNDGGVSTVGAVGTLVGPSGAVLNGGSHDRAPSCVRGYR